MATSERIVRALEKARDKERKEKAKKRAKKAASELIISKKVTNVWSEYRDSYVLFTDSLRISVHHWIDAEKELALAIWGAAALRMVELHGVLAEIKKEERDG